MEISTVLLLLFHFVTSHKTTNDFKVKYYVDIINNAVEEAKNYQPRKDNSDLLGSNPNSNPKDYGQFDFIVVGSGSSGSSFAAKMSEIEGFKILLLEAGDYDDDLTKVPYVATLLHNSDRNWGYFSTPQKNACLGFKNNRCSFPRGKILGGSSAIDGSTYIRGNRADFDKWAALGNPGWSFLEVLPFFKKIENFQSDKIDLKYRGFAGPVNIAYRKPPLNISVCYNAYKEIGVEPNEDYNAKTQIGISQIQDLTIFGEKVSGSTAYVRPTFTRENFNLTLKAFVTKILINKSTKTAYGVEFIKNGVTYQVTARKEVILSAGIVTTPQLLMLSGIGPSDELAKHNIPVMADLPVGRTFRGNVVFNVYFKVNSSLPLETLEDAVKQFLKGQGILTSFHNGVSISFHNTKNKFSSVPNIALISHGLSPVDLQLPQSRNFIPEVKKFKENLNFSHIEFFEISLWHPKSIGNITLKSRNPVDFPNINLGIFDNADDMETLYEAVKVIKSLTNTKTIKDLNYTMIKYDFCNDSEFDSKDYWFCAFKHLAFPGFQWASSVQMGPIGSPNAVVDNNLRVHGIKNLRVVDRSTIPVTLSGYYNPAALMMGQKAARQMKQEHGCIFSGIYSLNLTLVNVLP